MSSTFIFVRHGENLKTKDDAGRSVDNGLTPDGLEYAQRAAEWMQSIANSPGLIVHTRKPRTRQTARVIAGLYRDETPIFEARSGFSNMTGLEAKLTQWTRNRSADVVLFCGHHTSQVVLTNTFGLQLKPKERVVLVLKSPTEEDRDWSLVNHHVP